MTPEQGRAMYRAIRPVNPELPIYESEDRSIAGTLGGIPIRIYTPEGDGPFGILMSFHGGGWVTGESAGGNLSAVVALKARAEGGPTINFQCLLYPATDCDMTRGSYVENGVGYLLETETVRWFWDLYCPDAARRSEEYASPLRAKDLSRLPPALIVTAEFDPLRNEGEAYAEALSAAGNEVTAVRYDGLIHDFMARAYLPQ